MKAILEYQQVREGLFFWSAYEPAVKAELSCVAVVAHGGLLFIDPLPLATEPLAELTARFPPAAVVVTNGNHERASAEYAKRFAIPVLAHERARDEVPATEWIDEGTPRLAPFEVIHLPGFPAGEIALHGEGLLLVGDALIHLDPLGFCMLPDKYCPDPKQARASLGKLLRCEFEVLTFAHGAPLVQNAHRRLEALLHV